MLGYTVGIVFQNNGHHDSAAKNCGLGRSFLMSSPAVAPLTVMTLMMLQPESPQWNISKGLEYMDRGKSKDARTCFQSGFNTYLRLRRTSLQAARDMILTYYQSKIEAEQVRKRSSKERWCKKGGRELVSDVRVRNTCLRSIMCMFGQRLW